MLDNKIKRIEEIDVARGIGILFVILGHMESLSSDIWKQFAASFHMPLFFFISGILFAKKKIINNDFKKFTIHKLKRIIIPYILWALIYSNGIGLKQLICIVYGNNKVYAEAGLWFLPTLFMAECIFYLIKLISHKLGHHSDYILGIGCAVVSYLMYLYAQNNLLSKYGYPFSVDIALTAVCFILLGEKSSDWILKVTSNIRKKSLIIMLGIVLFGIVFLISRINIRFISDLAFNRVVMARASYGNHLLFLLGGFLGSLGIMFISSVLSRVEFLKYIGRNSLLYMCLNHFLIEILMIILQSLRIDYSITIIRFALVALSLVFVTIGCTIVAYIVNKFVPVLNGK